MDIAGKVMAYTTLESDRTYTGRVRLSATAVDTALGIIRGATVLKANVPALGKVVLLDSRGNITFDEKLAVKELPIYTDEKTLDTLLAAAKAAGNRSKSREDHDDSIGARAGYTENFLRDGDRISGDVHLFRSYRNRDLVLDTAEKTPEEIGLSIDFEPTYEIQADRALMRVKKLIAVDIVDQGAVTPDGLLLSAGVDTASNQKKTTKEIQPPDPMPDKTEPSIADVMAAVQKCMSAYDEMAKTMTAQGQALAKLSTPPPPPAKKDADGDDDGDNDAMKATLTKITEQLSSLQTNVSGLKKERALLGFRGTQAERAQLASGNASAEDIEKLSQDKKSYLQLVEDFVAREKCSRVKAHEVIQRTNEGSIAYQLHLSSKGVVRHTA